MTWFVRPINRESQESFYDVEMLQKFILCVRKGQNRLVAHFNLAALAADIPLYKGQIHKVALANAQEAIRCFSKLSDPLSVLVTRVAFWSVR